MSNGIYVKLEDVLALLPEDDVYTDFDKIDLERMNQKCIADMLQL